MGVSKTLGQISKDNYALIQTNGKLFLPSTVRDYWEVMVICCPLERGRPSPARHHSLYVCGVIIFTLRTLLHRAFSSKSASFNRSSWRNRHRPAANITNGSATTAVVQHAGIEHKRPPLSWK